MRSEMFSTSAAVKSKSRFLGAVFGGAAVLLAISMALTFRAGHVSIEAERKMNAQLQAIDAIRQLESLVKDSETGQRGFLLTGDEKYLAPYSDSLAQIKRQLDGMRKLALNGEIDKEKLDRLEDQIGQKLSELALTIRVHRETSPAAALEVVKSDRGKTIMDQIRSLADEMVKESQDTYSAAAHNADVISRYRTTMFIVVTILNLGFLTWAYRRISRQDWLQTGHSQLGEVIAGDQHLHDLGARALRFVAQYLGAQVGAIFIEESGTFRRFAAYALPSEAKTIESFTPGEGLLGQAVRDKKAFLVNDVPDGYLTVGSGLGNARPRHLLVGPMKVDGTVNAVMEFGFFRPISPLDMDLLERVSELMGTAVKSAQYRTRLQDLLEETQRQAEELQNQSEELRVSNEELEEQSRALKATQSRLELQQVELEQTNSQLEEQAQVLETQKDDLARAKTNLENQAAIVEQASRYKSDFLANMSHELRTPLNSSLILAKLLADNREGNLSAEQVKFATTIQSAGNDLLILINDVLDLAKVEAGRMELRAEAVPIADLVESLRGMFQPMAANKGLNLQLTVSPATPAAIETDRRRLEQVLKNMLSNAVKFTEAGEVGLEVGATPDNRVTFQVRDTGIGIAAKQLERIFEPFSQADGTTSRKFGGTGLGLSISRELARLMGGTLTVNSAEGKGSVFTLTLPLVAPKAGVEKQVSPTTLPPALASSNPSATKTAIARRSRVADDREQLQPARRTILIVEDDEPFAEILRDLARELNFQALVAQSAEESLALAKQFQPNAIILDIGLPDNSGMLVLERLKSDARTRHLPVHVVSGSDYSQPALAMGAIGYMLKPVKREQLVEAFQKLETRLTQKLRRVLLVEDDQVQLESLGRLIDSREVETVGVRTAAECLEKLKDSTFDCMVLDLSLPDASGFSLLETLSSEQAYSFPPVIIYTGRELTAEEEQKLRKYAKSIIIKGAKSPERLLDEVTLFLHQVVAELPPEQQQLLERARSRDAALEGRRILIVEDDVRNIFALTSLLEPKGAKLEIARNGREAIKALEQSAHGGKPRIDLVLMDIMMPEMNGFEAMREIRKNPDWARLPIIALTAKAMKNDQEQCIQAGASDYLAKPLDVDKLLSLIRVWMPR